MATKVRALKKMKYKGVRYAPGNEFDVKDKDALLFQHAKLAERIGDATADFVHKTPGPVSSPSPDVKPAVGNEEHPVGPPIKPAIGNEPSAPEPPKEAPKPVSAVTTQDLKPKPVEVHDAQVEKDEEKKDEKELGPPKRVDNPASKGSVDKEALWDKTKPELRSVCDDLGIDYKTSDSKGYIIDKICHALSYKRRDMRAED
jgi:outer membrane biosynthesis protein TonB